MDQWICGDKFFNEITSEIKDYEGFVYLITNNINGRKYIGKKSFWTRRKNKKTKKREKKESDWKTYYGSCASLTEDIKIYGKEHFKREIICFCATKLSLSYYETYEQFVNDVILTDDYYNTNIAGRFFVDEKQKGIYEVVNFKKSYINDKRIYMTGDNNPAKRPEVRKKLSEMFSGKNNPCYGKLLSEEHKHALITSRNIKISDGERVWPTIVSYIKEKRIGWPKYRKQLEDNLIFIVTKEEPTNN